MTPSVQDVFDDHQTEMLLLAVGDPESTRPQIRKAQRIDITRVLGLIRALLRDNIEGKERDLGIAARERFRIFETILAEEERDKPNRG